MATLGKVWGFLKYHHPSIASGQRHWHYALFRVLPQILFAPDSAAANALLDKWVVGFGAVADCTTCASLSEADLYMKPELKWISDEKLLGSDFSKDLQKILRNRPSSGNSFLCLTGRGHRQSSL